MISSLLLYALMTGLVTLSRKGSIRNRLGFKKNIKVTRETLISIGYLFLLLTISIVIGIIATHLGMEGDIEKVPSVIKQVPFKELIIILLIGSIAEEVFFRGYLQEKTNIWIASFIFAFFHVIYGSITEVAGAFFLGLALGHEYRKTKGIYAPTITHIAYNLIVILALFTA